MYDFYPLRKQDISKKTTMALLRWWAWFGTPQQAPWYPEYSRLRRLVWAELKRRGMTSLARSVDAWVGALLSSKYNHYRGCELPPYWAGTEVAERIK